MEHLEWILQNYEQILENRKFNVAKNSPIMLYPNGKIRIPKLGTFQDIDAAWKHLQRMNGNISQETL